MTNRMANLIFEMIFIAFFYGLVVMIAMPLGADPIAWSFWWDVLIVFIALVIYDFIFRFFGLRIHITNRHGVIKWTIKGGL